MAIKITAVVPWLVTVESTGWGEYLFVEVRTDQGITGWARSPRRPRSPIARSPTWCGSSTS
jgi:L-alanine-DL-glutamate epimerase-like enolase superfamily enzyme